MFKIATWNVNSLKVRLPHVIDWLNTHQPDVLALQETKVQDPDFPLEEITKAGYECIFSGQKTYNGVAILTRTKAAKLITDFPGLEDPQRRVLGIKVGEFQVLNLYVPNGESVVSQKYLYKLNWLKHLNAYLKQELNNNTHFIMLGDFNIAPEEMDVHDVKAWEGQVLFSEPERNALKDIFNLGMVDCFRLHEQPEKSFTWWDYRLNAFKRNLGVRIDHILANTALAKSCVRCYVDKAPRTLERPSDHAPVVAEFEI